MKRCPFCAEEIQDDAIKCRHCGEFLAKRPETKWYFKPSVLVIAILSLGPLALPLVWFNPSYSTKWKIIISVIVITLFVFLTIAVIHSVKSMLHYYREMLDGFQSP